MVKMKYGEIITTCLILTTQTKETLKYRGLKRSKPLAMAQDDDKLRRKAA